MRRINFERDEKNWSEMRIETRYMWCISCFYVLFLYMDSVADFHESL